MRDRHLDPLRLRRREALDRSDATFALLKSDGWYARPIPERHRFIFYLGHLEAFDKNLLASDSEPTALDRLFAFGIDPVDDDLPIEPASFWPKLEAVNAYAHSTRSFVDTLFEREIDRERIEMSIEHRLMHVETLAYMLHQLPYSLKEDGTQPPSLAGRGPIEHRRIEIPRGCATLGRTREEGFGWDNERDRHVVDVADFAIDAYPVTNARWLEFVAAGGYHDPSLWTADDWAWRVSAEIEGPTFWTKVQDRWMYRGMFALAPLDPDQPVYVSHAEASAFARWSHASLPTEAEWHRASCSSPDGKEREYPWGDAFDEGAGVFDFSAYDPLPSGAHPRGRSAYGVFDLAGNGWEWTSTALAPFEGFQPHPAYPRYSADFFDGRHFILKGASARTARDFLRRSFRNWYQPHYPYAYAKFRLVDR